MSTEPINLKVYGFYPALLAVGILIGYFLPRPQESSDADNASPTSDKAKITNRSDHPERSAEQLRRDDRVRSIAETIEKEHHGYHHANSKDVEISDIPDVINLLIEQAGPSGLSWRIRNDINRMLKKWAKEDFNGALNWARNHPNRNAASDFLQAIIEDHAESDFDSAMEIVSSLKDEPGIHLDLGSQFFERSVKRGAQEAFEALSAFPSDGSGWSGSDMDFPEGFDFKTFTELIAEHERKNPHASGKYAYFPTNVLDAWAKVDSTAALEFYLSGNALPYGDLGDITRAFLDLSDPASTYPWLAEQYQQLNDEERARFAGDMDSVFPREMGVNPLGGVIESLPTPELREQMVVDMLKGFGGTTYSNGEKTNIELLNYLPTPEKRLDALRNSSLQHATNSISDEKLESFGLTREQVNALYE